MNNNDDQNLQTPDEHGNAPVSRIKHASAAWAIVSRMIKHDNERSRKRAKIQGQIDGNAPYDDALLKRLGQASRSNINFRQAEGIRDARKTSYYELVMEAETLVAATIDAPDMEMTIREQYERTIAEEFTRMLIKWRGFWNMTFIHQEQYVTWGIGNCYWEDELDWRPKAARAGAFLVPDETEADIEDCDVIAIRDSYRLHTLFKFVKDDECEAKAKEAGWDTDLIKRVISQMCERSKLSDKWQLGDWESMQQQIKDNDLLYSYSDVQKVPISHVFVREANGKITHDIVVEDSEVNEEAVNNEKVGRFLFQKIERYKGWDQCVCLFFNGFGEGTYHSVKALGHKIHGHCAINDRLMNNTVDGAMASGTILLQPGNGAQMSQLRMTRVPPFGVVPPGFTLANQSALNMNFSGIMGVKNWLDANLNQNIGLNAPDVVDSEQKPTDETTLALRSRLTKEAKLERSDVNLYYTQWDHLYEEITRRVWSKRLLKEDPGAEQVFKFRKRCIDRGVPKELLTGEQVELCATRTIGNGSPVMQAILSADILAASAYFDERGKDNSVRDYVFARAGNAGVRRYKPIIDRDKIPGAEQSHAQLENNDLRQGLPVLVGSDQNHVFHAITHLRPLAEMADVFVNGQYNGDIEQLDVYFTGSITHSAQHLDYLQPDPARQTEYQMLKGQLQQLIQVHSQIQREANAQSKARQDQIVQQQEALAQAQEQAQGAEQAQKIAEIQADFQMKLIKEQNQQAIREEKMRHQNQLKTIKTLHEIEMDSAKAVGR